MMRISKRKKAMPSPSHGATADAAPGRGASLPDEMVSEVLRRLPVKSVLRFRAVSPSWAALLSSEGFRDLHLETAPARRKLLFLSPTPMLDSTSAYSRSLSARSGGDGLLFTLDCARGDLVEVVTPAPCRGLTLLYDARAGEHYLCNAATRAVTRLPPFRVRAAVCLTSTGLGFDARTGKYKVVTLINRWSHGDHDEDEVECEVYTPGVDHGDRWRPAAGGAVPSDLCRHIRTAVSRKLAPVFANGFLHWLIEPGWPGKEPRPAVVSFSLADETFSCIRSPPFWNAAAEVPPASDFWDAPDAAQQPLPLLEGGPFHVLGMALPSKDHLVEMDTQLCIVRDRRHSPYDSCLEIWRVLDYSSGDWSLHHRVDMRVASVLREPQIVRVIGSTEEKIVIATSKHLVYEKFQKNVYTYDLRSESLETIISVAEKSSSTFDDSTTFRFSLLEESLAPVHQTDEEIALSSALAKATKEILLRLPAKSATHSKLVSKQWLRLIESASFVHSYFEHRKMDARPKLVLVGMGTGQQGFSFAPLDTWLREAPPSSSTFLDTKVVCSKPCRGMNLLSTETKDYLYNPCTGFYMLLYRNRGPNMQLLLRTAKAEKYTLAVANRNVGLTFDPLTRQHVLVEILYRLKDFESRQYRLECKLRWSNSRDHVRQNSVPLPPLPVNDMPPAYLEGMLYWMSEPRLGRCCDWAVVSFNIATNVFDAIPCPSWFARWHSRTRCRAFVVELEGTLCAVLADPVADSLDIWKLEHGQWNRAYTVHLKACPDYSLGMNVVVPLAVDPDDGRILLNTGRKIGLYDPVQQTIQNLCSLDQSPLVTCSQEQPMRDLNEKDTKIIPFVPMLYEESLACYSHVAEARWLY